MCHLENIISFNLSLNKTKSSPCAIFCPLMRPWYRKLKCLDKEGTEVEVVASVVVVGCRCAAGKENSNKFLDSEGEKVEYGA